MDNKGNLKVDNGNPDNNQVLTDEIIDIENYAKSGQKPPKAKHYRIKIDKEVFVVDVPSMNGRELLKLAKKLPPEQFIVFQKLHGGKRERIELDEIVDFTKPGVEKFETLAIDPTEG